MKLDLFIFIANGLNNQNKTNPQKQTSNRLSWKKNALFI